MVGDITGPSIAVGGWVRGWVATLSGVPMGAGWVMLIENKWGCSGDGKESPLQ